MMAAAGILILYIDDDPALARLAQKTLGRAGYTVEIATDGPAGLARIAEGGVDAVVLDHTMPGQDGLATLGEIHKRADPPPVIYATGNEDSRVAVAALKIGGWLLVEESDGSSLRAVDQDHPFAEFFNRKTAEVYERAAHRSAANPYFGCRVRGLLEEAGLTDVANEGVTLIARGGELDARIRCMSNQALLQRGLLSQTECAELQNALSDPSFSYITVTVFAAWGKRAS